MKLFYLLLSEPGFKFPGLIRSILCAAMFILTLSSPDLFAQVPESMSYQAVIRNAEGQLIIEGSIRMRISILQGGPEGQSVYREVHESETNTNGLVSLKIGQGEPDQGQFADIPWAQGPFFLKTEVDPTGGHNYNIAGVSQMLSVPYAFHAGSADETDPLFSAWDRSEGIQIRREQVEDLEEISIGELGDVTLSGLSPGQVLMYDGSSNRWVVSDIEDLETDPLFSAWDRSEGIRIRASQVRNMPPYLLDIEQESIADLLDVRITDPEPGQILLFDPEEGGWVVSDVGQEEIDPTWLGPSNTDSSISRLGDVGIGVTEPSARLHLGREGAERLLLAGEVFTIFNNGYTGIGTTAPTAQLHTTGTVRFANYTGGFLMVDEDGNLDTGLGAVLFDAGHGLSWEETTLHSTWTQEGDHIYANTPGNVGIGTVSPESLLHVEGDENLAGGVLFQGVFDETIPLPVSGTGSRMMWVPERGAFRAGSVDDDQWDDDFVGPHSFATGYNTVASGSYGFAIGYNTVASGSSAIAMGEETSASGDYATAFGSQTTAGGNFATAWGESTHAEGNFATTWGESTHAEGSLATAWGYKTIATGNYATAFGNETTAEGTAAMAWGTSTIAGDNYSTSWGLNALASSTGSTAWGNNTASEGHYSTAWGVQATATGTAATSWGINTTAGGDYATAFGEEASASGDYATAFGSQTTAGGDFATAWGEDTHAEGSFATTWGESTHAAGNFATAWGESTHAEGNFATAWGESTHAEGNFATAWGENTTAAGNFATTWGENTTAMGDYSTAFGYASLAEGEHAVAWGHETTAPSAYETVMGRFNTEYSPESTEEWNPADRLFVIGAGTDEENRHNALTILKNGYIGIGTDSPQAQFHTDGTVRLANYSDGYLRVDADGNLGTGLGPELFDAGEGLSWEETTLHSPWSEYQGDIFTNNPGHTGIGTSSPTALLHLSGKAEAEPLLLVEVSSEEKEEHPLTALAVKPDGKTGLGTQDPEAQLHLSEDLQVDGSVRVEEDTEIKGELTLSALEDGFLQVDAEGKTTTRQPDWNAEPGSGTEILNKPTQISDFDMNAANRNIHNIADPVNAQDAATKAYVDAIKESIYNELLNAGLNAIVEDIEGNVYQTVKVGTQVWMAENLRTTTYRDGRDITHIGGSSLTAWQTTSSGAYTWYDDNQAAYRDQYGALYNWYAVTNESGLCPEGWRVPTEEDFEVLAEHLGGDSEAGGKIKETGTARWMTPNEGATNESGLNGRPGGRRNHQGHYGGDGERAYWWSSTSNTEDQALARRLKFDDSEFEPFEKPQRNGMSVRCVREEEEQISRATISTEAITAIDKESATGGGHISSDGGSTVTAYGICWNTTGYPTVDNNEGFTTDGNGTGSFESEMDGLQPNTTYYVRAYATNEAGTNYGEQVSFTTLSINPCTDLETITDAEGNQYNTIKMADGKCWMAENLRTTVYKNGDPIEYPGEDHTSWAGASEGAYAWYDNDPGEAGLYGALYNWYAVEDDRGLCPEGWRIPTDDELDQLISDLGGSASAGGKMKESGTIRWQHPNEGATNESGFTARPGGIRNEDGNYMYTGQRAAFWSSSAPGDHKAWSRILYHNSAESARNNELKERGFSIRCIRDE